jgi:hypothetical protein
VKHEVLGAVLGGVLRFTGSGYLYSLGAVWSSVLMVIVSRGEIYLEDLGVLFLDCARNNAHYFACVGEITRHTLVRQFDFVKSWGGNI